MATIDYDYDGYSMNNAYTYMAWQMVTATDSPEYKLKHDAGMTFDSEGFGVINGCYVVATANETEGGYIGTLGDYIDFTLASGEVLHCIVGESKSSGDAGWCPYGHRIPEYPPYTTLVVVEFCVDQSTWYSGGHGSKDNPGTSNNHPEWAGKIQSYEVKGNYWSGDYSPVSMDFYSALTENQRLYTMFLLGGYYGLRMWDYENHNTDGVSNKMGFMPWWEYHLYYFFQAMQENEYGKKQWELFSDDMKKVLNDSSSMFFYHYPENTGSFTDDFAKQWVSSVETAGDDAVKFQEYYWCVADAPSDLLPTFSMFNSPQYDTLTGGLKKIEGYVQNALGHGLPDNPTLDDIRTVFFLEACLYAGIKDSDLQNMCKDFDTTIDVLTRLDVLNSDVNKIISSYTTPSNDLRSYLGNVYTALKNWDGDTLPDNGFVHSFGYIGGYNTNGNGTDSSSGSNQQVTSWTAQISYVDTYGEQLVIHSKDGTRLICHKTMGNFWYPTNNGNVQSGNSSSNYMTGDNKPYTEATDDEPASGDPNYTAPSNIEEIWQWYVDHEGRYGYSTKDGDDYFNPDSSYLTNCSAFITWTARQLAPNSDMATQSGYSTSTMATAGVKIASGDSSTTFPYSLARPGDIWLVNFNGYNPNYDHVELFLGTEAQGNWTGSELWGAGSPPAPHKNYYPDNYMSYNGVTDWQVRRISWEN